MKFQFNKKAGIKVNQEIAKVVERDASGSFAAVDLSFEGVNAWRKSMGLSLLTKQEFDNHVTKPY